MSCSTLAGVVAGLAVFDAFLGVVQRYFTSRVGEGLIYDLRTQVFEHVQRQPIAFFTRAQTGSLVSRLNSDVIGAQQALTSTLSSVVSSVLQLVLVLAAMFFYSWLVTVIALVLIPIFLYPARRVGRRLQRLTRESMQLDAQMGSTMTERFNVAGAMLVKLYGQPDAESQACSPAGPRRSATSACCTALCGSALVIALSLLATLSTSVVYGVGGELVIDGAFQIGALVALATLLQRLYGPITVAVQRPGQRHDRAGQLRPGVRGAGPEAADRRTSRARCRWWWPARTTGRARAGPAADIDFDHVSFRYPAASEVSLASLESIALPEPERTDASLGVLHDVSFTAPAGQLTALVGPSGAGKTTITNLVSRLYDPDEGSVRIGGARHQGRHPGLAARRGRAWSPRTRTCSTTRSGPTCSTRGPGRPSRNWSDACRAAQIWDLISVLPDGLDTIVGDRGYRLSGGEKQRIALARLLLKAPAVVVLDEATAHLDSESEAAVQRALKTALAGRTSLVIAHRLSTIREADQILVIDDGQIRQRGRHAANCSPPAACTPSCTGRSSPARSPPRWPDPGGPVLCCCAQPSSLPAL